MRNSTFLRNQATVLVRQRSILGARGGHCWLRWGALLATLILFPSLSLGTATPQLLRVSDALRLAEENGAITVRSQNDLFRTESRRVQAEHEHGDPAQRDEHAQDGVDRVPTGDRQERRDHDDRPDREGQEGGHVGLLLPRPLGDLGGRVVLEQPLLVVDPLGPRRRRLIELRRQADGVAGARLLAVAAVDAAEHVDLERADLTVLQRELVERRHLLLAQGPRNRIQQSLVVIPQLCKRLEQEARRGLISRRQAVVMQMAALDALSPLAILQRGFSIVQTVSNGRVLRRASDVAVGESVQVRLAEGQLVCQVDKVMPSSIA